MYFEGDEGVIVAGTDEGSPAREAGIQERDRLLAVNGQKVTALTAEDLPAIQRAVGLLKFGKPVSVELLRGDEKRSVSLTPSRKGRVEGEELDCPRWDLTVKAINQFDNPDLHFYRSEGVFIFGVEYPGNASDARLMQQDVIVEIGGVPVKTLGDVKEIYDTAVAQIDTKTRLLFTVLRNGLTRQVILDFARDYERK
jgi:S1-C subfamily serine protease